MGARDSRGKGSKNISYGAVRAAQEAEVAALVALINEAYLVERHFVSGPRTTEAAVRAMVAAQEFIVLDAMVDGAPHLLAGARLYVADGAGHLGLISVQPGQQGRGLGRRIIAVAEALALADGADRMELQVVNVRTELTDFYQRLGYKPIGTSPFDDTKNTLQPVHFIEMSKSLPGL